MDLSINKLNGKNLIKFQGIKGDLSKKNTPVFKFYPPAYDRSNEIALLEFTPVRADKSTGEYIAPKPEEFKSIEFKDGEPIELSQEKVKAFTDSFASENFSCDAFAYRYAIKNKEARRNAKPKYIIDDSRTIELGNTTKANLIDMGANYGVTPKTGPIRHSFIDSDAILQTKNKLKGYDPDFVRNHFNKLGGSISGLTYLLTRTDELKPYRYILSTPDIGVDGISSHKYWPNNQYQCTDIEEFKNFIFELYKQGKGYIADGAFTSQGLQSPIVQHVLKWGKKSPFYNMLKVDSNLQLGIIPDRSPLEDVGDFDYIGVKMVNNPHRADYDPNKATYIQFFDTRLVKDKTRDKNELIKQYDREPKDHYDITNHQNSVVPYYFEVRPDDKKRVNKFIEKDHITLNELKETGELDDFLKFNNFSIVSKAHAAGANFWDGSRDIIKMNLSNPTGEKANREGFFNARNYLLGVASYWSELVQTDLILKTAKSSEAERQQIAKNNDVGDYQKFKSAIGQMHFPVLEQNKQVQKYVKEFPLQSIETDPSLSAIFSEPDFQKEFFDEFTTNQILTIINSALDSIIPDKYAGNSEYRIYATKVYANKLIKNLLVGAMCPNALDEKGEIKPKELREVSLYSLKAQNATDVEEERKIIENKLKRAINPKVLKGTIEALSEEMSKIELDDFKTAEAIVLQGKAGLNWRFDASRDIGDLDSIRDGSSTFEYIWYGDEETPGVQDFWTDFVTNIKTYNPASYIISELTNMGSFPGDTEEEHFDFNKKMARLNLSKDQMYHLTENNFMNGTGSTTISNYEQYFNNLSMFVGENPEHGSDVSGTAGNLHFLKERVDTMLADYQPNSSILSHAFVDNHDKPRLLHTMPLITWLFLKDNLKDCDDKMKEKITNLTGRDDYENISGCAVAVGLAFKDLIDTKYGSSDKAKSLTDSLANLVNGKKDKDSEPNFRRADAFGHLPYEVTIRDMFKGAGIENEEEMLDFRYDFLKKSIKYETKLWEIMNAVVGSPTLFNGMEFFQTGYESPSHNFYVANRNQTMHEMKDDKRFAKHYQTIYNISSLYQKPALRAIRDGFPVSGKVIDDKVDKFQVWPIYQDNGKGSKVITLITNNGVPRGNVQDSDAENKMRNWDYLELDFGREVIEDGEHLRRIYLDDKGKYVTDKTDYIIEKHGEGKNAKYRIKGANGEQIHLYGTVERYFVPTAKIKGQF